MQKIVLSNSYGAGFCFTNETVYNWMRDHGVECLIETYGSTWGETYRFKGEHLRYNSYVIQCIEELGSEKTGYTVEEYDDTKYECWVNDYDGLESLELQPVLDVKLMLTMSEEELAAYLDDFDIKHNYGK